jgi:MYXO-CTERM domain-containing protein
MRRAFKDAQGASYYVVPGARACLFREDIAGRLTGTCNRTEAIAQGLVMESEGDGDAAAGHVRMMGLAPDGVRRVAIRLTPQSPEVIADVHDNVWTTELEGSAEAEPAELSFVDGAGTHQVVLPRANDVPDEGAIPAAEGGPASEAAGGCSVSHAPSSETWRWALMPALAAFAATALGRRRRRPPTLR